MGGVKKVYLIDNSTEDIDLASITTLDNSISYITNQGNKGIAFALNVAAEHAERDGFEWLIQLDQDSIPPVEMPEVYSNIINNIDNNVGIVCCSHVDNQSLQCGNLGVLEDVLLPITSGSAIRLKALRTIGMYDSKLFIDGVDHDISIRLQLAGYRIIKVKEMYLNHNLGDVSTISLAGMKIHNNLGHSPMRYYYIMRNYSYLKNKYANTIFITQPEFNLNMIKKIIIILLFEKNKVKYLLSILAGIIDAHNNNFRTYEELCRSNFLLRRL